MPTALGTVASHRTAAAGSGLPMTGLALWFDADDATTFTYGTGVVVNQWRDKSGGAHHASNPGLPRPVHDATINGRTAVNFGGGAGLPNTLQITPFASAYTAAEIFIVQDLITENDGAFLGPSWGTATTNSHYPTGNVVYESWGTTTRQTVGNPVTDLLTPHIYNVRTGPNLFEATFNGTENLFTTTSNTVGFKSTGLYELGMNLNPPNTIVGEVVMYDRVLSTGERGQVVAYLKTRWGIA